MQTRRAPRVARVDAAERVEPCSRACGAGGEPLNSADVRELRRVVAENRRLEERCTRFEAERDAARGELKVISMHVLAISSWLNACTVHRTQPQP